MSALGRRRADVRLLPSFPSLAFLACTAARLESLDMGRTRPPASSAPLSRTLPKRARLSTTRFDTAAIASAPQQQHDPIRHKDSRKPKPKPKPAARQSVKTQAGISRDSGGTTTTGQSTALRAKVLAAVVRLSREKKRGQRGVGHSSVNTYRASSLPPSLSSLVSSTDDDELTQSLPPQSPATLLPPRPAP